MNDKLLTTKETAKYLRVHPVTIIKWAEDGKIPAHKVGRGWRFRKEEIDQAIQDGIGIDEN